MNKQRLDKFLMLENILVINKATYVAKDAQNVNLFVLNNLGMRENISLINIEIKIVRYSLYQKECAIKKQ